MTQYEKQELLNQYYGEQMTLKAALASKDYQTIREAEGGEPMKDITKEERAQMRVRINELDELIKETEAIVPEEPERPDFDMEHMPKEA